MASKFYSPLRYPGGKSFLAEYIVALIKNNNLENGIYAEPYAGGAGAALYLLLNDHVERIKINDASPQIYCFWKSLLTKTDEFKLLIEKTPITIEERAKQAKILEKYRSYTELELGFATFFLNRVNRSGILDGGPIGGYDQSGKWKIDARYYKETVLGRIDKIVKKKNFIDVTKKDAIKFLREDLIAKYTPKDKVFVYMDPPYYEQGNRLYLDYYNHKDHEKLSTFIAEELNLPWLLSYDNVSEIKKLYSDFRPRTFSLRHKANFHKEGSEILFYSNLLKKPSMPIAA